MKNLLIAFILFISTNTSADIVWDAVQVQCIPELGHLEFTTTSFRGYQLYELNEEGLKKIIESHGIIMDGQDAKGQCQLGTDTIKWEFQDHHEPGIGQCGGGYWGGKLNIVMNDKTLFKNIPFGGDHYEPCRGSSLQELSINEYQGSTMYEIHLGGYWEQAPSYTYQNRITWPVTKDLFSKWGVCQLDYSKETLEWCETHSVLITYQ